MTFLITSAMAQAVKIEGLALWGVQQLAVEQDLWAYGVLTSTRVVIKYFASMKVKNLMKLFVVTIFIIMFVPGCQDSKQNILYCDLDHIGWGRSIVEIDLDSMRVFFGDEVSSFIEPIKQGEFVGITEPFPILLFNDSVDRNKLKKGIISGDYKFSFVSLEANNSDWWLITANAIGDGEKKNRSNAKILYSLKNGVLAINLTSVFEPDINLIPCDNKTLKYNDMLSIQGNHPGQTKQIHLK